MSPARLAALEAQAANPPDVLCSVEAPVLRRLLAERALLLGAAMMTLYREDRGYSLFPGDAEALRAAIEKAGAT